MTNRTGADSGSTRRRRRTARRVAAGALAVAAAAVWAAPGVAGAETGESPAAPAAAGQVSPPAIPVATEKASQVAALEKALHIGNQLATEDVEVQSEVGNLNANIEELLGNAYAEVWFDPWHARFDVGVAPATKADLPDLRALIAERGLQAVTQFVNVTSTHQELAAAESGWVARSGPLMAKSEAAVSIDAASNEVVVEVSEADSSGEAQSLVQATKSAPAAASGSGSVAVVSKAVPAAKLQVAPRACVFRAKSADYCDPPLVTGTEIYSPPVNGVFHICTAGFMAVSIEEAQYPDHYLLTAGHCFEGASGYQNGEWGSANHAEQGRGIGYLGYRFIGAQGDAAFINLDVNTSYWLDAHGDSWYPYVYTPGESWGGASGEYYPINIVGTNEPPNVQYQTPCHVGVATEVQCGVTTATNVSEGISYEAGTVVVGNLVQNTACAAPGDSGGPWIFNNYAMGLTVGGGANCGGSVFDDLHAIDHNLGMKVVGFAGTVE